MPKQLIQQVQILDCVNNSEQVSDILISDDNQILDIAPNISPVPDDTAVEDYTGLILGPGLADLYSYCSEPGYEERETLESIVNAAQAGGFTSLALLPSTLPVIDNPGTLSLVKKRLSEIAPAQPEMVQFWGALSLGVEGEMMTEFADLNKAGVVGFADGRPVKNLALLRRMLEYIKPLNMPVALWPCDSYLKGAGVMREGSDSIRFGLPGIPTIAETSALSSLLEVIALTGTPAHIMRISTARSVQLIAQAKNQGLPITASTTWHHLILDTRAVECYNPALNLSPPLPTPQDRQHLIEAIKNGVLDAIAIDHRPYTYEEKTVAFGEAPAGAIGLEIALPLLWQNLVETAELTPLELWLSLSSNPRACLKQKSQPISPGNSLQDITIFDPNKTWKLEPKNLKSLSTNSFWLGKELTGKVIKTWARQSF